MGKQTHYHPVSLHVVRGAAEYCGFQFGKLKQVKSDELEKSATYVAEIKMIPLRCVEMPLRGVMKELSDCFNVDIVVLEMRQSSKSGFSATILTRIPQDPVNAEESPVNRDGRFIE